MSKEYVKQQKLGEGTYAVVYSGRQVSTNRRVAIKKIKLGQFKEGLDMSAIREVKFLRELHHENVIQLIDVFSHRQSLNLILEFLAADLEHLINDKDIIFSRGDVKSWLLMMLRGLHHLHSRFILHRDLKPNNLLLSDRGVLKIADFGLARDYGQAYTNMSPNVVTRWYRAPELFLGARSYGTGIDIWASGCIFAEILLRTPFMPGENDLSQLDKIFQALGTPTAEQWPGFKDLPGFVEFNVYPRPDQKLLFTAASDQELDLLSSMLALDPLKRLTTTQALRHSYFTDLPRPTAPEKLPVRGGGLKKVVSNLKRPAGDMQVDAPRPKEARVLKF